MNVLGWAANLLEQQTPVPSGAIDDVVAVRQSDGSRNCSPFHIKLARGCKKGEKKLVKLRVNGKDVDVCMRLGPAGEVFFIKRTHEVRSTHTERPFKGNETKPTAPTNSQDDSQNTFVCRIVSGRGRSLSESHIMSCHSAENLTSTSRNMAPAAPVVPVIVASEERKVMHLPARHKRKWGPEPAPPSKGDP
jgi:phosphatidate phosphatase PAH1